MAGEPEVRETRVAFEAVSARPFDEVVDQDAHPSLRPGTEVAQHLGQVVDPLEQLDDDALDAQVVAPDPLDELGVVTALDEDPAGAGDSRLGVVDGDRAAGGARRPRRCRPRDRRGQDHRPALEEEARAEREGAPLAATVLQGDGVQVAVDGDDLAAPVGGDLLDDQPVVGGCLHRAAPLRDLPVSSQHVGPVAIHDGQP